MQVGALPVFFLFFFRILCFFLFLPFSRENKLSCCSLEGNYRYSSGLCESLFITHRSGFASDTVRATGGECSLFFFFSREFERTPMLMLQGTRPKNLIGTDCRWNCSAFLLVQCDVDDRSVIDRYLKQKFNN